jgi:hypothetical protein
MKIEYGGAAIANIDLFEAVFEPEPSRTMAVLLGIDII